MALGMFCAHLAWPVRLKDLERMLGWNALVSHVFEVVTRFDLVHIFGRIEVHDSTVSGLARILEEYSWDLDGSAMVTCGDPAYGLGRHSFLSSTSCHSSRDGITVCPSLAEPCSGTLVLHLTCRAPPTFPARIKSSQHRKDCSAPSQFFF